MTTVLVVIGYLLAGLLALLLVLIALLLWSPVEFAGAAHLNVEPTADGFDWTSVATSDAEDGLPVAVEAAAEGEVRLLWGAVAVSNEGIRLLWWRRGLGSPAAAASEKRGLRAARRVARVRSKQANGEEARGPRRVGWRTGHKITLQDLRRLLPDLRRALAASWSALRLRLRADVTLGLEDPATTGILAGAVPALGQLLTASTNQHRPGSVIYNFSPVFDREVLTADIALSGRTSLSGIAWPWVRLGLRRDVRKLWWPTRRRNPKGGSTK